MDSWTVLDWYTGFFVVVECCMVLHCGLGLDALGNEVMKTRADGQANICLEELSHTNYSYTLTFSGSGVSLNSTF